MKRLLLTVALILTAALLAYGADPVSIQQMFQNSPKETDPQGATRVITVRGGVVRQMSYSSVSKQGPKGDTGATGATGAAGTLTIGTVTTGAAGTSATATNTGTPTAAVINLTIPRGDTGLQGSSGTVAIGTTTTGAPGSNAIVTNSGTPSNAVFNFTIPEGKQGAQGIQGPTGAQGVAGGSTNWRGEWTAYTQYANNDAVSYAGSSYIALTDVEGIAPSDQLYWNLLASKGATGANGYTPVKGVDYIDGANGYTPVKGVDYFDGAKGDKGDKGDTGAAGGTVAFKGAWNSTTNYVALDVVTYNGSSYVAKVSSLNISPTVTASWQLMAQKGADGATGAQGIQGIQGIQGEVGPNAVTSSTTTNYNGILKGNGSTVGTATAGTDYLAPTGNGSQLTGLTKTQVGLPNVDNTSDASKPISTATQTALDLKATLATVELTGDAALTPDTAYLATGTGTWTFSTSASAKQTTLDARVAGTVCAAAGSLLYWSNPITDTAYSALCASVPAGTKAEFQMAGGKIYARSNRNLQQANTPPTATITITNLTP